MVNRIIFTVLVLLSGPDPGADESHRGEIVAVLSAGSRPYQEALEGLLQEYESVAVVDLAQGEPAIPETVKAIVAFGGKAALYSYPKDKWVVYSLAPAGSIFHKSNLKAVEVFMVPEPEILLAKMKIVQPGLGRLALLWIAPEFQDRASAIAQAAPAKAIRIVMAPAQDGVNLPRLLRSLKGRVDALWLMPDPLLINEQNFNTVKDFCWGNRIPFYVPTESLAKNGATAAISVSFQSMGRSAGKVIRSVLEEKKQTDEVYPEPVELTVNLTAAERTGLEISPSLEKNVDKVIKP